MPTPMSLTIVSIFSLSCRFFLITCVPLYRVLECRERRLQIKCIIIHYYCMVTTVMKEKKNTIFLRYFIISHHQNVIRTIPPITALLQLQSPFEGEPMERPWTERTLASMRSRRSSTIKGSLVNSLNRYCHSQVSWPNVPLVTKKIPLKKKAGLDTLSREYTQTSIGYRRNRACT